MKEGVANAVKAGIFWVVPNGCGGQGVIEFCKNFCLSEADGNGFINYPYSHYEMWDEVSGYGRDCYRYPRGRVLFDVNANRHKIFADECVSGEAIDEIVMLFDINDYVLCRDEHYVCAKCSVKKKKDLPMLEYNILRGRDKIGENLIEISYGDTCALVELGKALDGGEQLSDTEKAVLQKLYSAVVVSHYHEDHAGLIAYKQDCAIYIGAGAKRVLEAMSCYRGESFPENIVPYRNGVPFFIGNENKIKVTPYLCDHSAFDSYMLLFEAGGKSILYTGDFRFHGRKDKMRLLSNLPQSVDVLIHEGTNIGNSKAVITEAELENRAVEIIRGTNKPIFVLQSSSNIDRLVSIYRASKSSGRILYMDNYASLIASAVGGRVPRPDVFSDVYAFTPRLIYGKRKDMFFEIENKRGVKQIASGQPFVILVRASMSDFIERLKKYMYLSGSTLIYSMWDGYKQNDDMKRFLSLITDMDIDIADLHTSGHALEQDIELLKQTVTAKETVCVHTQG